MSNVDKKQLKQFSLKFFTDDMTINLDMLYVKLMWKNE